MKPDGGAPSRRAALGLIAGAAAAAVAFGLAGCAPLERRQAVPAATIHVLTSGGFTAAFGKLAPAYEQRAHVRIETGYGPSMGTTANAIPARLARGDTTDVVILAREALDQLAAKGQVVPPSRTDLGLSRIAVAVKAGAPAQDISTPDALRRTLLAARSIAISDSASGVYIKSVLFPKLGIADEMSRTARMIPAEPVGKVVARGDAEIGFQQLSELKPIAGIRIIGLIPEQTQKVTIFSAGIAANSAHKNEARALVRFLSSREAYQIIRDSGMEPAGAAGDR